MQHTRPTMFPASKPSIVDRGDRSGEDSDGRSAPLFMPPPLPVPTVNYGSDDDDSLRRLCRICLESDHPEDLIAPCLCKGSSKWVHRTCLDLWRTHEQDRAFATCTECQFQYRYEKQPQEGLALDRRTRFCLFVSRDACLVTAAVQAVIVLMGLLAYAVLHTDEDLNFVCPAVNSTDSSYSDYTNQQGYNSDKSESFGCRHEYVTYYLLGLFGLLVCMGIFGSVFLCSNGCQVPDLSGDGVESNDNYLAQGDAADSYNRDMRQQRSQFYSHHRQRQHARREQDYRCCAGDPCFRCDMCCYRGTIRTTMDITDLVITLTIQLAAAVVATALRRTTTAAQMSMETVAVARSAAAAMIMIAIMEKEHTSYWLCFWSLPLSWPLSACLWVSLSVS